MNIDSIMKELKDQLKQTGTEHKATYKAVISSRIDTTALKREQPGVAAQYTRATETRRFTFMCNLQTGAGEISCSSLLDKYIWVIAIL